MPVFLVIIDPANPKNSRTITAANSEKHLQPVASDPAWLVVGKRQARELLRMKSATSSAPPPRVRPVVTPRPVARSTAPRAIEPDKMTAQQLQASGWTFAKLLANGYDIREMRRRGQLTRW